MRRQQPKSLLDILWSRIKKAPETPKGVVAPRPFQAVSIYCGGEGCPTALRFRDHRFLAKDVPQLPLPSCTHPTACKCRYLKHKDRRTEARRFADLALRREFTQERRRRRGRRATD